MRIIITYKNFPMSHNVSHIGLGVSALNTAKVLRQHHINADVWAIMGAKTLTERIKIDTENKNRPTHVVIAAPWIPTLELQMLVFANSDIQFVVTCHSNVGFLQGDPRGVELFRDALNLEQGSLNFQAAGNSKRFVQWVKDSYGRPCTYLPNLYFMERDFPVSRPLWDGGLLKIGTFGAIRPLKNLMSAGGAVLEIANNLHCEVEFHISAGRIEGAHTVLRSLAAMLKDVPGVKLVCDNWQQWPQFRRIVRSMHLLIQASYTESFNMVTADGAVESIPSVVSGAIDWAPKDWQANVDDSLDIARRGRHLLKDRDAGFDGFFALKKHNDEGVGAWKEWIEGS